LTDLAYAYLWQNQTFDLVDLAIMTFSNPFNFLYLTAESPFDKRVNPQIRRSGKEPPTPHFPESVGQREMVLEA